MENVQRNYIGGTWVPPGATAPNVNPSNLNDVVANYARARPDEAEAAIAAAKAAFSGYSRSTPQERYEALKKVSDELLTRKDELGRLLSREEGKTLPEGMEPCSFRRISRRASWCRPNAVKPASIVALTASVLAPGTGSSYSMIPSQSLIFSPPASLMLALSHDARRAFRRSTIVHRECAQSSLQVFQGHFVFPPRRNAYHTSPRRRK